MALVESKAKRKIPDRLPRKEISSAGYGLSVFAQSLDGLTLKPHRLLAQPSLSRRSQRKVELNAGPQTSEVVSMEHMEVVGEDIIMYDTFPADWQTWNVLATKRFRTPKEKRVGHLTGVSVAWITTEADGSHKLAIQKRDIRNQTNPSTYGPSASGAWDAETIDTQSGKVILDPSDANARKNVFRETSEELGLSEGLLRDPRVKLSLAAIVEDRRKPHHDLIYFGILPYSANEVKQVHDKARKADNGKDYGHGGTDGLTFVDASPVSIRKMLTEVTSPFPPVSVATFLMAGYMIVMQETLEQTGDQGKAQQAARLWKAETEKGIEKNYAKMVRRARLNNTLTGTEMLREAVRKGVRRKEFRTEVEQCVQLIGRKYDTAKLPQDQGLQDVEEALKANGIEKHHFPRTPLDALIDPTGKHAEEHQTLMELLDPAIVKLNALSRVTEVPWFSFLKRLQEADDPITQIMYGPTETRLARLQYRIGNGYEFMQVPGSGRNVALQADTWGSDIKFDGKAERKLNEDAILAIPFGDGRILSGVFDGASSQRPISGLERYGVSGAWYVSHIAALEFPHSDEFKALSQNSNTTARDVMVTLNTWLHGKLSEVDGVNYDDVLYLPGMAATLAVVDYNKQAVDIAHVADTIALVEYNNHAKIVTNNRNKSWDEATQAFVDIIVEESRQQGHTLSPLEASRDPRVKAQLAQSFSQKINTPYGTGIVNGQTELVDNDLIQTVTIPFTQEGGMRLHLLSDGIATPWIGRKDVTEEIAMRKLLGALYVPQYSPRNPIYDGVIILDTDTEAQILPRIIKQYDDATRVTLVIKPGKQAFTNFQRENRALVAEDIGQISALLEERRRKLS